MSASSSIVVLWSPSNPKELISFDAKTGTDSRPLVHDDNHGEGCNTFERRALRAILEVAEEGSPSQPLLEFSKRYRTAVYECLEEWSDSLTATPSHAQASLALQSLQRTYTAMQLSEIYFPLVDYDSPALVTADTVRFLRNHYSRLPHDTAAIQHELDHPYDMDHPLFWDNMTVAVITGRLDIAAELLLQFPVVVSMMKHHDRNEQGRFQQDVWNLVTMFRKAPIPGSPYDDKDDSLQLIVGDSDTTMGEYGDVDRRVAALDPDHHLLWEPSSSVFSPPGATRALQQWQATLRDLHFPYLIKYLEPLGDLLSIVCGRQQSLRNRPWYELLLTQLLYQTPTLKPRDTIGRIASFVEGTKEAWMVPVLQGEGAVALEEMANERAHAALPGTLCTLWFDLCVSWNALANDPDTHTELVCTAAEAILSNHEDDLDVGLQLASRWLVLFALRSKNQETYERYTLLLAELLDHYFPSSDDYAMTLLRYCEPLIINNKLKSIPILDGCVGFLWVLFEKHMASFDFDSARAFLSEEDAEGATARGEMKAAVQVLERALELEEIVLEDDTAELGRCHGQLESFCWETCRSMMNVLTDASTVVNILPIAQAKGLLEAAGDDPDALLPSLSCYQELKATFNVYAVMNDETASADDVGESLATCVNVCGGSHEGLLLLLLKHVQSSREASNRGSVLGDHAETILLEYGEEAEAMIKGSRALLFTEMGSRFEAKCREQYA